MLQMTLNFTCPSQRLVFLATSLFLKLLFRMSFLSLAFRSNSRSIYSCNASVLSVRYRQGWNRYTLKVSPIFDIDTSLKSIVDTFVDIDINKYRYRYSIFDIDTSASKKFCACHLPCMLLPFYLELDHSAGGCLAVNCFKSSASGYNGLVCRSA